MDNFYCPLHATSECIKTEVNAIVDCWNIFECSACSELDRSTEKLSSWFHNTQEKIPQDLKNQIKKSPVEFFHIDDDGRQSYTCYRYLDSQMTKINLYHYGMGFSFKKVNNKIEIDYHSKKITKVRLNIQTQKKNRYQDLPDADNLPIDIVRDEQYLIKILK